MDEVNALQHDAAGERVLAEAWSALSGRPADFAAEEEPARREILARSFGAQLDACAASFAGGELGTPLLRRVLGELLAHFPVYRTYGRDGVLSPADRAVLDRAAAGARRTCLATDRWAIDPVLRRFGERDRARGLARFQQLSAPIAAKAVEDTGFYRWGRLLSRNDVGFDPATFALDADAFHRRMQVRRADWPRALLATATHDHKRGEDVRARLAVLSGMAAEWAALQRDWVEASRPLARAMSDGKRAPGPGDVALLLQTIVGAWPFDLEAGDSAGRRAFAERLVAWQQKALREAKLASDWAAIDEAYEAAARDFTVALVADAALPDLLQRIAALVQRIAPAGALNGLAQCLLRMTAPGVPDLYQGAELWDLSLVDPDNRRPVDWPRRLAGPPAGPLVELAARLARRPDQAGPDRAQPQAAAAPLAAVRGRRLSAGQARGAAGRCHDRLRPPAAGIVGAGGGAAAGAAPAPGAARRAPCARWLARHRSCARRRSRRRHERSRRRAARGRRRSHVARRPVWNAAPGARLGRHDDARQGAALSLIDWRGSAGRSSRALNKSCAVSSCGGPEQPRFGRHVYRRCWGGWLDMHRILVVEDENWLAMELAWLVQEAGYAVLGPERSVAEALKVLRTMTVDLALLDVALGGETVFPLSRMLEGLGVPFIFVTGNPGSAARGIQRAAAGAQAVGADGAPVADTPGARRAAHRALVTTTARSRECHGTSAPIVITARPLVRGGAHADRMGRESRRAARFGQGHGRARQGGHRGLSRRARGGGHPVLPQGPGHG